MGGQILVALYAGFHNIKCNTGCGPLHTVGNASLTASPDVVHVSFAQHGHDRCHRCVMMMLADQVQQAPCFWSGCICVESGYFHFWEILSNSLVQAFNAWCWALLKWGVHCTPGVSWWWAPPSGKGFALWEPGCCNACGQPTGSAPAFMSMARRTGRTWHRPVLNA